MAMLETELGSHESDPRPLGTVIGERYALRRVLGRGAGAVVYAAEHVRVHRPVALKLPWTVPELRELLCARLRRETDALARVRHPNVVDVIDAGESDGLPYLAMELLEGRTLSGLIAARGRLSADETIKVGIALAEGLAAVHAAGFVHRDVKPSNVLVTRAAERQVHLCDFGIVKAAGPGAPTAAKLTYSGALVGTPEYMALEALIGDEDADPRIDVYALGITLFECLTGRLPVEGSLTQVLQRLTSSSLPRVTDVVADAPPSLSALIARCLEHDRAARFADMNQLADALRACGSRPADAVDLLRAQPPPVPATAKLAGTQCATARREHARAPYVTVVVVQCDRSADRSARIEDISEGGVLIMARDRLTAGETVRMRFGLPISGRVVTVAATVRWSRDARNGAAAGLEFMELPDGPRAEIRQYVALMGAPRSTAR